MGLYKFEFEFHVDEVVSGHYDDGFANKSPGGTTGAMPPLLGTTGMRRYPI